MRAKILQKRDIIGIVLLAFGVVLLYSLVGASFLHSQALTPGAEALRAVQTR